MMFERYTEGARRAIFFARFEASQFGTSEITTEHLLLGLFRADRPLMTNYLGGAADEEIRREIERHTVPAQKSVPTSGGLPLSAEGKRILGRAAEEADRLNEKHIGTKHLLLALVAEQNSFAAQLLQRKGLEYPSLLKNLSQFSRPTPEPGRRWTELLDEPGAQAGAYWGAGYVRKTQSVGRLFHWERRLVEPRDALLKRGTECIVLYTGQSYDPDEFGLVKNGWRHDHCVICWKMLYLPDNPQHSFGYTDGQEWLCEKCYKIFAV